MTTILTLVAADKKHPVKTSHVKETLKLLEYYNIMPGAKPNWLTRDIAVEIESPEAISAPLLMHLRDTFDKSRIDIFTGPAKNRVKKLVLADMDSTIVTGETLDDLAEHAGIKDQIAAITARAMNGELDFHAALNERVGLLKGLPASALQETLNKMQLSPGAQMFISTMRNAGAHCVLVSGGFTFFTGAVAEQCGFHNHHGNVLEIENDALTGKVIPPILDKFAKVEFLKSYIEDLNLTPADCLTIGDGANDIPMLKMAQNAGGLGIGYQPKDAVAAEIHNTIRFGTLTSALYAQGIVPQ